MCLYPSLIKNRKYLPNKKNGWQAPPILDVRTAYVPKGCGECKECKKQKAREWQVRLSEDIREYPNCKFICLTLSNESIKKLAEASMNKTDYEIYIEEVEKPKDKKTERRVKKLEDKKKGYGLDNAIATIGVRRFLERYRKKYKTSIRHWLITELGHKGTENIHVHGILWLKTNNWIQELEEIEKIWQYGHMWKWKIINNEKVNWVNEQTIAYMTKYVNKIDKDHKLYKSIILNSDEIGKSYIKRIDAKKNEYKDKETKETYQLKNGRKIALPTYYRNLLYNEEQREKLWTNKLDKQERWVNGTRIDISKDEKEYYRTLKQAQKENEELGYGSDKKNWKRKKYEEERRIIIQETRIKAAKTTERKAFEGRPKEEGSGDEYPSGK